MNQPLAYVHPGAKIAKNVVIEPFTTIHNNVIIGDGTWIGSNVTIMEGARIGKNCNIFPGAVISAIPQDLKFGGEDSLTIIGDNCTIRECVTINRGTIASGQTTLGNNCLIMATAHIAHDCHVGDRTIFANNAALAGHVHIGDWAILGGFSNVHQFCKIGAHAMVGMSTSLTQDVPPFVILNGNPAAAHGINIEGLKRRGFSREQISAIRQAYRTLYKSGLTLDEAKAALEQEIAEAPSDVAQHIQLMRNFLDTSTRGIVR